MINAQDLRIGNWVKDRGEKLIRIDFFEHLEKNYSCKFGMNNDIVDEFGPLHPFTEYTEYAIPIPLTEEILLKCGFEKRKENNFYIDEEKYHTISILKVNNQYMPSIKSNHHEVGQMFSLYGIQYLHQLQNLYFALTNKELEVNL